MFIGEREVKDFTASEGGDIVHIVFTNGEKTEMSGTLFHEIQTEEAVPGVTTMQLVGSYFATEWLKDLALNHVQLGTISTILSAFENIIENKKVKAFGHVFGRKHFMNVGIDQMMVEADTAEQEEEIERVEAEQKEAAAKETEAKPEEEVKSNEV